MGVHDRLARLPRLRRPRHLRRAGRERPASPLCDRRDPRPAAELRRIRGTGPGADRGPVVQQLSICAHRKCGIRKHTRKPAQLLLPCIDLSRCRRGDRRILPGRCDRPRRHRLAHDLRKGHPPGGSRDGSVAAAGTRRAIRHARRSAARGNALPGRSARPARRADPHVRVRLPLHRPRLRLAGGRSRVRRVGLRGHPRSASTRS